MHDKVMRAHDAAPIKFVLATMALLTRFPTLPDVMPLATSNARRCLPQASKSAIDVMQPGTLAQTARVLLNRLIDCFAGLGFGGTTKNGRVQAEMTIQMWSAKNGNQRRDRCNRCDRCDRCWQNACLPSRLTH